MYKVVQIWPGRFVCKQVTVCPGHIWTTLYFHKNLTNFGFTSARTNTVTETRISYGIQLTRTPYTWSSQYIKFPKNCVSLRHSALNCLRVYPLPTRQSFSKNLPNFEQVIHKTRTAVLMTNFSIFSNNTSLRLTDSSLKRPVSKRLNMTVIFRVDLPATLTLPDVSPPHTHSISSPLAFVSFSLLLIQIFYRSKFRLIKQFKQKAPASVK